MEANGHESRLLYKDEAFQIVAFAFEVLKELGHGLHERPYENALVVEFNLRKILCSQQQRFPVIDTKVIDRSTDHERGQMLNYLKITGLHVGLLPNFKRRKLEWERIVH